jgi:hypothetical protein
LTNPPGCSTLKAAEETLAADSFNINLFAISILIGLTILGLALVHPVARRVLRTVGTLKNVPQDRRQQYVTLGDRS